MTELHWLTANEIREGYAARRLSPTELVRALLERISAVDDRVHAFITVDAEGALHAAGIAEKEIAAGRTLGPLHGVPVAIKDIIDVAGLRTTCHSKILLDNIAASDAAVITRLRAAGAIILGKLAMHEFATGNASFDLPFPPARNPWNLGHHPGGSSSGAGAALAAGLTPLALGTDTGGSVRSPAAACGVVGLKPTYGAVSLDGVTPLAPSLDHVGSMARCVDDVGLLFDAIANREARGPARALSSDDPFSASAKGDIRGMRVGFVRHFHEQDLNADPEVAAALEEVSRVLTQQGAHVRTIVLPPLQSFSSAQRTVMLAESWAVHADRLRTRPGDYGRAARRRLMGGAFLSAGDYMRAQERKAALSATVDEAFRDTDVLLTANAMDPACKIDDDEAILRTYPRQSRDPFNLTGHPALAMMCGLSRSGLPLSAQLVARFDDERTLLRAGAAYERVTDWHARRPAL